MSDLPERIVDRVVQFADQQAREDRCWIWPLSTVNTGYGQIGWGDGDKRGHALAHRLSWVVFRGPIPEGMTVDHLCRNRRCFNPHHLRLLTNQENASDNGLATRTHCPAGHAYAGDNLYVSPSGDRRCRRCARRRQLERKAS